MRDTHRERQRHQQREKRTPCREADAGLDPRMPGSCSQPKAGAQLLSHPGIPLLHLKKKLFINLRERVRARAEGGEEGEENLQQATSGGA